MLTTYMLRMCKSYNLAPVVQTLDTAIHRIITIQRISIWETNFVTHWIEIYPSDSDIYLLNNWGLVIRTVGFFGHPQ